MVHLYKYHEVSHLILEFLLSSTNMAVMTSRENHLLVLCIRPATTFCLAVRISIKISKKLLLVAISYYQFLSLPRLNRYFTIRMKNVVQIVQ